MVILREKERMIYSSNLLIRVSEYDTIRTDTVLPLQEIQTGDRYMKCSRMVRITKNPGEDDGCRKNPDKCSGILMNLSMEYQCHIVENNRRNR